MKINIYKNFQYSNIFDNVQHLTAYLSSDLVIQEIVFIVSTDDSIEYSAITKLVQRRKQFRGQYRLDLKEFNLLESRNNEVRSEIDEMFKNIMDDLERTKSSVLSTDDASDYEVNVSDELTVTFNTFKPISGRATFCDLNKESLKFLLTQALTEIMAHMHYDEHHFNQMWNLFHQRCFVNATAAQKIRNLADDYKADQAINYYTQDSCLFRFLNEIL
ncbi:unnamed protein product [Rotaria magnacalcarata]|uniref:Uncharacterized protein n=2 Tax=Rotaria magnacalcarata TaxID=392030 RepID=A0A820SQS7_9BILA|nr:unnamed protein product [Rotaria magnacalcarata]